MSDQTSIKCPKCGNSIDVNEILKHQLEDSIRLEYQATANAQATELATKNEEFEKAKAEFEAKKKLENEMFADRLGKLKKFLKKKLRQK